MINIVLENIKIAFVSILGNKVRSALTILGVVIGVFAIITIIAIGSGLKDEIVRQIVSLGANILDIIPGEMDGGGFGSAVGLQEKFTQKDVENLKKKATFLEGVTGMYEFAASLEYGKEDSNIIVIGCDPIYFEFRERKTVAGKLFTEDQDLNRDKVTVIGNQTAIDLFKNPKLAINQTIRINGLDFKVIGVLEKENFGFGGFNIDKAAYLSSLTVDKYFPDVGIMEIFTRTKDETQIDQAKKQVEFILKETRKDKKFTVMSQESILKLVDNITGIITSALAGLASVSLIVGGIGIMNIMLVSVTERTKEIGIRKAIGATDTQILIQFMTESIILCLIGGIVGLSFASGISAVISHYFNFPTLINLQTIFGAIGFSIVVGVIFGTAPALKAARKDPVEALRYE